MKFSKQNIAILITAVWVSATGDAIMFMGISLHLFSQTNTYWSVGILLILKMSAHLFVNPIAMAYGDRWPKKKTIHISYALSGIILCTWLIAPFNLTIAYSVLFGLSILFQLCRIMLSSLVGQITPINHLDRINTLINTAPHVALFLGFGAGGILLESMGLRTIIGINAITFFIATCLLFYISKIKSTRSIAHNVMQIRFDMFWSEIKKHDLIKRILFPSLILQMVGGTMSAVYVGIAMNLNFSMSTIGMAQSFTGIGSIIIAIVLMIRTPSRHYQTFISAIAGLIIACNAFGFSQHIWQFAALWMLIGICNLITLVKCRTIIQTTLAPCYHTRTFSFLALCSGTINIIFVIISSKAADYWQGTHVLMIIGFISLAFFIWYVLKYYRTAIK